MTRAEIERLGINWPTPYDGLPFTSGEIARQTPVERYHRLPPGYPDREVVTEWAPVWDESLEEFVEEPVAWRLLSDEEWSNALDAYQRAKAEFDRTGGVVFVPGAISITGIFRGEGNLVASGVYDNGTWHWLAVRW